MKRTKVYVAGAYSADNVLQVLRNMKRGMKLATECFQTKKILPFVPWFDYQFILMENDEAEKITIEDVYQYSLSFLTDWAEAVLIQQDGWAESKGTVAEMNKARELGLPVFFTLETLLDWIERKG
jgi:hypothetical protein